jgi:hypothetical protein
MGDNMPGRSLSQKEKKEILNRDGWCCNNCGYVPTITSSDMPHTTKDFRFITSFINSLRKPIIFVKADYMGRDEAGDIIYDLFLLQGGELEFDHVTPIIEGGSSSLDNIQALCKKCHHIKSCMEYVYPEHKKYIIHKYMRNFAVLP